MITLPCRVSRGQFSYEYFIEIDLSGRKRQYFVDKSQVHNMAKELNDSTESVDGEVEVFVVDENKDTVLVALPQGTDTGSTKFRVTRNCLKLYGDADVDLRMKRVWRRLKETSERYPTFDSEQGKSSGDFV